MIGIKDMDMPNSCDMCDFYEDILCCDGEHSYCGFPRMGEVVEDYIASRHPDCPLAELENKEK